MSAQQSRHVFISYVRENSETVTRLYRDLKKQGVHVWLDRKEIKPGFFWRDAIRQAIVDGAYFMACFSREYLSRTKSYMNEELTLAIDELRQHPPSHPWFIPVLLSECDVPARSIGAGQTLMDIQWVPLYEDWEAGIQKIISTIKPANPETQRLVAALHSNSGMVRYEAGKVLRMTDDKSAIPLLIEALKSDVLGTRVKAANTLAYIGDASCTPALIELLKDRKCEVRSAAIQALEWIGKPKKQVINALTKCLNDRSLLNRGQAIKALQAMTGVKKRDIPVSFVKAVNTGRKGLVLTPEFRKELQAAARARWEKRKGNSRTNSSGKFQKE